MSKVLRDFPPVLPNAFPAYSVVRLARDASRPFVVVFNRRHFNRIIDFYGDERCAKRRARDLNKGYCP
jgi:hypothetical protein